MTISIGFARTAPAIILLAGALALPAQDPSATLAQAIRPFIQKNCQSCHNATLPSGNIDLTALLAASNSLSDRRDTWNDVAAQIRTGLMPPEGAPKPPKADADQTVDLISKAVAGAPRTAAAPAPAPKANEPATNDWLTFNYDPERTGWARGETKLTKDSVKNLELKWRLQIDNKPDPGEKYLTLTDAMVVNNVQTRQGPKRMLYVASHDNIVYAIDADKGAVVWQRAFPNSLDPKVPQTGQCGNNLNANPVIDPKTGILYFLPTDGKLRGVSIVDGEDRFPATKAIPPYTRPFSLNLVDGVIWASTTRGCQNEISELVGINVEDPDHTVSHFATSTGKGSGVWGRGGLVKTPWGVLAQTADGAYDPAAGRWGSSVIQVNKFGRLVDSFTPIDQVALDARDFDLGSTSPLTFEFGGRTLVATSGKEGRIYLLDARSLGGKDHRTPLYTSARWSNDAQLFGYNGMWSVMSTYLDKQGRRWLLAPFYGPAAKDVVTLFPKQHGQTFNGVLMAFTVEGTAEKPYIVPRWMSADMDLPGIAVVANGVILEIANGDRASMAIPGGQGRGGDAGDGGGGGGGRGGNANAANGPGRGGNPNGPGRGGNANAAANPPGRGGRGLVNYDANMPGSERDQAWLDSQRVPFEQGGQKGGTRFTGGRDNTHAILYALDPETGDELYSSGNAIDSWNHYGGISVSDGNIYVSTWDARVYAFGLKK
jgi:outer membrane protein assembly factor BamB